MIHGMSHYMDDYVALLAEGVDRNWHTGAEPYTLTGSPSSRRAWIEIALSIRTARPATVALLAEGVDRNLSATVIPNVQAGRPPRGGRG